MPFGFYIADGEVLQLHRENNTSVIVLLAEEVECLQKAKRNLHDFYLEQGFRMIHLPTAGFNIPRVEELARAVEQTFDQHLSRGMMRSASGPVYLDGACAALLMRVALQSAVLSPDLSVPCMALPLTRPVYCAPPAVNPI